MEHYNNYLNLVCKILDNNGITSNIELDNLCKKLFEELYVGSFPSDRIPNLKPYECAIINSDQSNQSGTHWLTILQNPAGTLLKYNSFGDTQASVVVNISSALNADLDSEQKTIENNCGQRSIAWLLVYYLHGEDIALTI